MAFPDNYEENTGRCMGKYKDHRWSQSGHPLSHRCIDCHKLRWKEIKVIEEVPRTYIPSIVWGAHN